MEEKDVNLPVQSISGKAMPTGGGGDNQDQDNDAMLEMAQAAPSCNIPNLIMGRYT